MPCGFDRKRTVRAYRSGPRPPGWEDLPAVRARSVVAVHGSHYFNRPGPRLVDGLEILASVLHPERSGAWSPPEGGYQWVDDGGARGNLD